nr:ECF-type sigma factor [Acanthopleuribacter pedis]
MNLVVEFAFEELKLRARGLLRENRLVDTGELVNAAYIKLTKMENCQFQNRGQFYNLVATIMRNFLVDEVRRRGSGESVPVPGTDV